MRLKRYEILLPLVYNDGREIEEEKFFQTSEELLEEFEAITTDTIIAKGSWLYEGVIYKDQLVRIRVDAPDKSDTKRFFRQYKEVLKDRFRQIDIWITTYTIEVI